MNNETEISKEARDAAVKVIAAEVAQWRSAYGWNIIPVAIDEAINSATKELRQENERLKEDAKRVFCLKQEVERLKAKYEPKFELTDEEQAIAELERIHTMLGGRSVNRDAAKDIANVILQLQRERDSLKQEVEKWMQESDRQGWKI